MKQLYKVMPMVATAVLLVAGIFLFTACDKEEETIINPIKPDVSVKAKLDNFFSRENYTLANQFSDSVYIINSKEELKALGCDDIKINFKKYCIIWGKVTAYHSGSNCSISFLSNAFVSKSSSIFIFGICILVPLSTHILLYLSKVIYSLEHACPNIK